MIRILHDDDQKIEILTTKLLKRLRKRITFTNMYINDDNSILNIVEDMYTDKCKYEEDYYFHVCYRHAIRVRDNARKIIKYHEDKGYRKYTIKEKIIVDIAALYHDIGKIFKKKHHNYWSVVIFNYLVENIEIRDTRLTKDMIKEINECILYHCKKTKYRDKISILTKILRDADRMDEMCGESLLHLAASYINNCDPDGESKSISDLNLNFMNYTKSDLIINNRNLQMTKDMMKKEINMEINYELYLELLNEVTEVYDRMTGYHRFKNKYMVIV